MADEAIRSIRTLFLASVVVLAIWFLSLPTAIQKLDDYRAALDLHAWLSIRETLPPMIEADATLFDSGLGETLTELTRVAYTPRGDDYQEPVPLLLTATWPEPGRHAFTLEPVVTATTKELPDEVRVYRVQARGGGLPFSDYLAVITSQPIGPLGAQLAVVPFDDADFRSDAELGLRHFLTAAAARHRPRLWDTAQLLLAAAGGGGAAPSPANLSSDDPAVAALRRDLDVLLIEEGVQVFGINVSLGIFFAAAGLLLGAVAFAMLGPLLALRHGGPPVGRAVWTLAAPTRGGPLRNVFEGVLILVTAAWCLLPIGVVTFRTGVDMPLRGLAAALSPFGVAGSLFACAVFAVVSYELHRRRRARPSTERGASSGDVPG